MRTAAVDVSRSGRAVPGGAIPASLAVCTRNRPESFARTLSSAMSTTDSAVPVIVVDQSDGETAAEVARLCSDAGARVRYVRDPVPGASRARNQALLAAQTPLVVFLDDDCTLPAGAFDAFVTACRDAPDAAIAFGGVRAALVPTDGFVPTYRPRRSAVLRGRASKLRDGGIGALMALRREAALGAGGFDERLGPGAELRACEEGELAYRLLKAGYALLHVPGAVADHYGVKRAAEGTQYAFHTYRGIGAAYAMHLWAGDPVAALLLLQEAARIGFGMAGAMLTRRGPFGVAKLRGLASGVVRGWHISPPVHGALLRTGIPASEGEAR